VDVVATVSGDLSPIFIQHLSLGFPYDMGKARDHKDAAQGIAPDFSDIAGQLASLKGEANSWLPGPDYDTLSTAWRTPMLHWRLPPWSPSGGYG